MEKIKICNDSSESRKIPINLYILENKIDLECNFYENRNITFFGKVFGDISNVNKYLEIGGKKKTVKAYGEKDYTHNIKIPYNDVLENKYCYLVLKVLDKEKIFEIKRISRDFTDNICVCNAKILGDYKINGNR